MTAVLLLSVLLIIVVYMILFYKNTRILFYNMQNVLDRFSTI